MYDWKRIRLIKQFMYQNIIKWPPYTGTCNNYECMYAELVG